MWLCIPKVPPPPPKKKKNLLNKFNLLNEDENQSVLQADIIVFGGSAQNSNIAKSLLYLKKEVKVEVDFLLADKHQTFLQDDAINFGGQCQSCPKYPK